MNKPVAISARPTAASHTQNGTINNNIKAPIAMAKTARSLRLSLNLRPMVAPPYHYMRGEICELWVHVLN